MTETGGWVGKAEVYGPVQGQGSKRLGRNQATGKPLLLDANPKTRSWRQDLRREMLRTAPERPLDCAVRVYLTIYVPRPRSHYGTGRNKDRLKPSAPVFPPVGVDVDKVARAALDAGTGVWWSDDRRVAFLIVRRLYVRQEVPEGAYVTAAALGAEEDLALSLGGRKAGVEG